MSSKVRIEKYWWKDRQTETDITIRNRAPPRSEPKRFKPTKHRNLSFTFHGLRVLVLPLIYFCCALEYFLSGIIIINSYGFEYELWSTLMRLVWSNLKGWREVNWLKKTWIILVESLEQKLNFTFENTHLWFKMCFKKL